MANWSEIPNDILEHLTSFLPFQDCLRFAAVCKNWSNVAKEKCRPPARQIPWLALGEDNDTKKRKFYNLLEERHYYLDVPELRNKVLCGSKYGWLFTLDCKLNFHLVNPLTRQCYNLPYPPLYIDGYSEGNEHDLSRYLEVESYGEHAHEDTRILLEDLQRSLVFKATLDYDPSKTSDFTVFILYGPDHMPSFWRPGNDGWTDITITDLYRLDDIAFYKGKFYAVSSAVFDINYAIYVIDVSLEPKVTQVVPCVPLPDDPDYSLDNSYATYIVDLDGEFVIVERFVDSFYNRVTIEFIIHKLDFENKCYTRCSHIDRHTIFLGSNSAVVISPDQFPDCMKDAIYFTDIDSLLDSSGAKDLGIYDMIGNQITSYYSRDIYHASLAAPMWFTPNP